MPETDSASYGADEQRWSALMVSAQAGDEGDYRLLLAEVSRAVTRYLVARFGASEFVDDCVQDSLIAIHQARHTFDPRRPFRAWLFAIVRHKAIDTLRRQRTRQQALERYRAGAGTGSGADGPDGGPAAASLLRALPAAHREALTLTKILGLSTAEAAERLAISESALKVRVHRGVSRLRQLLDTETL